MKLKEGFILRKVAGNHVVFPIGNSTVDFHGMLALNETGAFLWERIAEGAQKNQLCDALCAEYDISPDTALADVEDFIKKLTDEGYIEL